MARSVRGGHPVLGIGTRRDAHWRGKGPSRIARPQRPHRLGMTPMEYLLTWRMALAKRMLREQDLGVDQVARRVGYGSASPFSVAFARHAGMPPGQYARADRAA